MTRLPERSASTRFGRQPDAPAPAVDCFHATRHRGRLSAAQALGKDHWCFEVGTAVELRSAADLLRLTG